MVRSAGISSRDRFRSKIRSNRALICAPEANSGFLLIKVQAEARACAVDPPAADLAQAPYSRLLRPGICDPGQALRIRDLSKTAALLGKADAPAVGGDRDVLVAVEDDLRAERRVPGHR